jgi:glycerol-3-phosphate dehydrogenase
MDNPPAWCATCCAEGKKMRRAPEALTEQPFDLVILGGGITGAGVALDAVLRGLRVALLERGDFACATSSASTKLVHGGLRYLEHGDFALVYEALHERRRLLRNAPHLVWPLRFVIPFYASARVPGWKWRVGLLLYDLLAGPGNLRPSRTLHAGRLRCDYPALEAHGLAGGAEYFDAQMDDARLCLEVIRTAHERGAVVCNYVEVVAFEDREGLRAVDRLSGRELRVRGRVVLNATGPWCDHVRRLAGEAGEPLLAATKGAHLVAPGRELDAAFLLLHPRDGRVFFVLPWLGKTLIGTTDTDLNVPDEATVTDADVDYLLEGHNHHFRPALSRGDLLGNFVGVRPLLRSRPGEPSARSREWKLVSGPTGLLSVAGGKWTTYRHMAEGITDEVMRRLGRRGRCVTRCLPLDGTPAGAWPEYKAAATKALCRDFGLPEASARHLVRRYGRRCHEVARMLMPALAGPIVEGEPDLLVELDYQREHEMAIRPEDFLLRRTRLGLFHPELLPLFNAMPSETRGERETRRGAAKQEGFAPPIPRPVALP